MKRLFKQAISQIYNNLTVHKIDADSLSVNQLLNKTFDLLNYKVTVANRYILKQRAKEKPCRIVIGSNGIFSQGWIPTEIDFFNILKIEHWERYFSKESIDSILAEHVWEHLTIEEGILAAKLCFKYLRSSGGYLRIAVPDGYHPNPKYIEWVKPGGTGISADDHKVLYTYKNFKEVFELAGFQVELLEYFDEYGQFHYQEWNPNDGIIYRSKRFDARNQEEKLGYTSIILDARK